MKKISITIILTIIISAFSVFNVFADEIISIEAENYNSSSGSIPSFATNGGTIAVTSGKWVSYEVDFLTSGKYSLNLKRANIAVLSVDIDIDGISQESFSLPSTGSISNYQIGELAVFNVKSGIHTVKITVNSPVSMESFTIERIGEFEKSSLEDFNKIDAVDYDSGENILSEDEKVLLDETSSIEYILKSDNTDAYTMKITALNISDSAIVNIFLNNEIMFSKNLKATQNDEYITAKIGNMLIPEGDNTLKMTFENLQGEQIIIKSFELNKMNTDNIGDYTSESIHAEFENYNPGGEGVGYHDTTEGLDATYYVDRGDDVEVAKGGTGFVIGATESEWWKYDITVNKSGKYKVYVNAGVPNEGNQLKFTLNEGRTTVLTLQSTGAWGTYTKADIGYIDLAAGDYTLKVEMVGSCNLDYFEFTSINTDFDFYAAYVKDKAMIGNRTIARGTDEIDLYFTSEVNENFPDDSIKISGDRGDIYFDKEVDGNIIKLYLKNTLDYSAQYYMELGNINNLYGETLSDSYSVLFQTSDKESDEGDSKIDIISAISEYEKITIKANSLSTADIGISKRQIDLYYKDPLGNISAVAKNIAVSGENGEIEIVYNLPSDSECGVYTFFLSDEYTKTPFEKQVTYISESKEKDFLEALNLSTNVSDVIGIFETYEKNLGINISDDLSDFSDKTLFFNHFIGISLENINDFYKEYDKLTVFETLNQTDDEKNTEDIVFDEKKSHKLGFDLNKALIIKNNHSDYIKELANISVQDSFNEYKKLYDEITDKWFAIEFEKSDINLLVSDKNVYVGQGAELKLTTDKTITDVKKAEYVFSCDNDAVFANVKVNPNNGGTYEIENQSGKMTIIIYPQRLSTQTADMGTITFTSPFIGTFNISILGSVCYDMQNGYLINVGINAAQYKINVLQAPSYSGSSGGGGGGGGGISSPSGSTAVSEIKKEDTIKPDDETEKYAFIDLNNSLWAEDSINYLLSKGVVSESDDKLFKPSDNVLREQFVKMIAVSLGLTDKNAVCNFNDVDSSQWYYPHIAGAFKNKIITGDENNNFGIGKQITRQDMAVIIYRALNASVKENINNTENLFNDDEDISDYAKDAVYAMKNLGIISGTGNNNFAPKENATRAQAAKIIYELMRAVGL